MEHCGGGTLADLLRADGPFPTGQVVAVGSTICDALDYAHSKGIVHRDVKPGNVLVGDDGVLKVGDFGIAKAVNPTTEITTTGKIIGTVTYISPEHAGDLEVDTRSDLYSLGVVLYELAVGQPPFEEATSVATAMKHLHDAPPSPRSRRAVVSRRLEAVILKALEKDPDARFSSAAEMKEALRSLGAPAGDATTIVRATTTNAAPPAGGDPSFRDETKWLVPVIGVIVAALVVVAALAALFRADTGGVSRDPDDAPGAGGTRLAAGTPSDFDPPPGDGTEDSTGLAEVVDGDPTTTWKTDIYATPLSVQKPGVGILFDLGRSLDVVRVEVTTPDDDMTLEVLAGDDAPSNAADLEIIDSVVTDPGKLTFPTDISARYWLIWITDLPGGTGGVGSIGEVRFFGP
jgi:serine/threonine-protein kinase